MLKNNFWSTKLISIFMLNKKKIKVIYKYKGNFCVQLFVECIHE